MAGVALGWRVGADPKILEVMTMEVFLFIVFVAICALLLYRATNNPKKDVDPGHQREQREGKAGRRRAKTPAAGTTARPGQPWHSRRHPASKGASRYVPPAPTPWSAEMEYDGYSRRDRHHVIKNKAHIKDEGHLEDPAADREKKFGGQGLAH
jgi:hypothetical protein